MTDTLKLTAAVEGDSCPPSCSRLDTARLQWILDHVTNLECTEMIAGNQDRFFLPATREDIDREMRGTSPMLGQCTCHDGMCGCLDCPLHGMPKADSSANAIAQAPKPAPQDS